MNQNQTSRNRKPPIPPSKAFASDADYRRSQARQDIEQRRADEEDYTIPSESDTDKDE